MRFGTKELPLEASRVSGRWPLPLRQVHCANGNVFLAGQGPLLSRPSNRASDFVVCLDSESANTNWIDHDREHSGDLLSLDRELFYLRRQARRDGNKTVAYALGASIYDWSGNKRRTVDCHLPQPTIYGPHYYGASDYMHVAASRHHSTNEPIVYGFPADFSSVVFSREFGVLPLPDSFPNTHRFLKSGPSGVLVREKFAWVWLTCRSDPPARYTCLYKIDLSSNTSSSPLLFGAPAQDFVGAKGQFAPDGSLFFVVTVQETAMSSYAVLYKIDPNSMTQVKDRTWPIVIDQPRNLIIDDIACNTNAIHIVGRKRSGSYFHPFVDSYKYTGFRSHFFSQDFHSDDREHWGSVRVGVTSDHFFLFGFSRLMSRDVVEKADLVVKKYDQYGNLA